MTVVLSSLFPLASRRPSQSLLRLATIPMQEALHTCRGRPHPDFSENSTLRVWCGAPAPQCWKHRSVPPPQRDDYTGPSGLSTTKSRCSAHRRASPPGSDLRDSAGSADSHGLREGSVLAQSLPSHVILGTHMLVRSCTCPPMRHLWATR